MKIYLYSRQTKTLIEENAFKINGLLFLYQTLPGKLLTNLILKRRFISGAYGRWMKRKGSVKLIDEFIRHYEIDTGEIKAPINSFGSFNDFFIRELKASARPVDTAPTHLISPADSRLIIFDLGNTGELPVKGYWYQLDELVKNEALASEYRDGLCFIYRLAPSDYHRFNYIDDGHQDKVTAINGILHSVNRIALSVTDAVMAKNYRELTVLDTQNFGRVVQLEVGALFVGKVIQRFNGPHTFKRGEEKGWFEFGGSTIIQLFKKGAIVPDEDIVAQSKSGVETIVKVGEKVGVKGV